MNRHKTFAYIVTIMLLTSLSLLAGDKMLPIEVLPFEKEKHFTNIKMLTHGGENAEAYFNRDASWICWQGKWTGDVLADQIWTMPIEGGVPQMLSTGNGKTTCSWFVPGKFQIVYCSTHDFSLAPPEPPDRNLGYVWGLDEYDVYIVNRDGSNLTRLTENPGYDAEAAVSPDGMTVVFTSVRNGDLDIYTMDINGNNVNQLTNTLGYDGGPFFSPDGQWIVFRSHLPETPEETEKYQELLNKRMVSPVRFEIQIMRPNGTERRQITNLGVASFAPYMHPDGKRIIFCSNYNWGNKPDQGMPVFNLFMIDVDGENLEQITFNDTFDGFPMFSNDGAKIIWASNRYSPEPRSTNIFIADWTE
ncbi:TolB family protein [Calditrichota bacterium]